MNRSLESTTLDEVVCGIEAGEAEAEDELCRRTAQGIRFLMERQLGSRGVEAHVAGALQAAVDAIQSGRVNDSSQLKGFLRETVQRRIAQELQHRLDSNSGAMAKPALNERETERARTTLENLGDVQREILVRYYDRRETRDSICRSLSMSVERFEQERAAAKRAFEGASNGHGMPKPVSAAATAAQFLLGARDVRQS